MTFSISIKLDKPIGPFLQNVGESATPSAARAVLRAANHMGGEIARVVVEKFPGGTGQLAGSFMPAAFVESTRGVAAGALSDLPHARVLDSGEPDPIVSSRGPEKMLAIPLSGVAKTKWPRDWAKDDLTLIKSKNDNLILAGIEGSGEKAKITPHYLLLAEVSIKGRHYVDEATKRGRPRVNEILNEELQTGLDEAVDEFNA